MSTKDEPSWTTEQTELLRTLWSQGVGERRIAVKVGHSHPALRRKVTALGLPERNTSTRKPDHKWPDYKRASFARDWRSGMSVKRLMERYGITRTAVLEARARFDLAPRRAAPGAVHAVDVKVYLSPAVYDKAGKAAVAASMSLSGWIARTVQAKLEV